jgi:hypothetical protein
VQNSSIRKSNRGFSTYLGSAIILRRHLLCVKVQYTLALTQPPQGCVPLHLITAKRPSVFDLVINYGVDAVGLSHSNCTFIFLCRQLSQAVLLRFPSEVRNLHAPCHLHTAASTLFVSQLNASIGTWRLFVFLRALAVWNPSSLYRYNGCSALSEAADIADFRHRHHDVQAGRSTTNAF